MRHRVAGYKLGRKTNHRRAMWRNMAISLLTHGQITTTLPKAKSVRPFIEKLITNAKKGDLAARRRVIRAIGDPIAVDRDLKEASRAELRDDGFKVNKYHELEDGPRVVKKLFDEIASQFENREGGYTRIIKLATHRIGDGSDLCVLQLVGDSDSGPQVTGRYSRRRDQANHRMKVAAALRKGGRGKEADQNEQEIEDSIDQTGAEPEEQAEVEGKGTQ